MSRLFRQVLLGAAVASLEVAGTALLPAAWPILRGALGPVLERLKERIGVDPMASQEAAKRAAEEFERDARLQDLLRSGLLDALDPVLKSGAKVEQDVQQLCVLVMENTQALQVIARDIGDIRERLDEGMELSAPAEERLVAAVAERVVVMQQTREFADRELQATAEPPQPPDAWLGRQDLMDAAADAQTAAITELREGRVSEAMERLRRGQIVLAKALVETPADATVRLMNGYLLKTMAQVSEEAGDRAAASEYVSRAQHIFELLVADLPADEESVTELAGAINGLGNLFQARGDYEAAIERYEQATALVPSYAYAWHDLFSAYDALARQGDVRLIELERSYARLRGVAAGTPGLGPDYLDQLGEQLESWKRRAGTQAG
jgi:tetratricopeptide (TPR) repeat protein